MEKSRYIPAAVSREVKKESGFRCAWCGCYLTIKHHIESFSSGGLHSVENLILLCPNCHTDLHTEKISKGELDKRKIALTGSVDRSSGNLSINKGDLHVDMGGFRSTNCKNILVFNNLPLISVRNDNGYLLLSLKLFDENDRLICWMSDNRWWVENEGILDFIHSKSGLKVLGPDKRTVFTLEILDESIQILGSLYLSSGKIQLLKHSIFVMGNEFNGCSARGNDNAFVVVEKSFKGKTTGSTGFRVVIND